MTPTDVVTVSYTAPTGEGAKPLRDFAGNNVADLTNQAVRNDKSKISFTSDPGEDGTYSWNRGDGTEDIIEVTVTFSQPVIVAGEPALILRVGSATRRAVYHSGSGTSSLVFRYPVAYGDTDFDGILVYRRTIEGLLRYASTNVVAPGWVLTDPYVEYPVHRVDAVRPVLASADVAANGTALDLRWSEALAEDSVPTTSDPGFEVLDTNTNTSREISSISIRGRVVTLTLSSTVSAGDQLTVSYEMPSSKPVKDAVGNYADNFSSTTVSVTTNPNSPPEFPTTEDGARSVDENSSAGRNIGSPIAATDADSDGRTYSISGADAALFDVVSTSVQLRTRDALDHESRDSYSFTMSVTDGKDPHGNGDTTVDDTVDVTVTVNDVNEGPAVTGETDISVEENTETFSRTFSASDPGGGGIQLYLELVGYGRWGLQH